MPLSSIYSRGGSVGCVDVIIQRKYPLQVMFYKSAQKIEWLCYESTCIDVVDGKNKWKLCFSHNSS